MSKAEPNRNDIGQVLEKMDEAHLFAPDKARVKYEIIRNPKDGYPSALDQIRVIAFLRSRHAIRISSVDQNASYVVDFIGGGKGIVFEPISPTFGELCNEYPVHKDRILHDASGEYWVVRDEEGNFWFDGNRVHFKNPNGGYARIFSTIYSLVPYGGDVSYSRIKKLLPKADRDAVLRALSGEKANLYAYVPGIKYMLDFQTPLFDAIPGKGIRFNNKKSKHL